MALTTDFPTFSCDECGSPSILIEGPMSSTVPVLCAGCGRHLGEWDCFADQLERRMHDRTVRQGHADRMTHLSE